jgi:hypothetical protein
LKRVERVVLRTLHEACSGNRDMSLQSSLRLAQNEVPDCLAVSCVDLRTGALLGAQSTGDHPPETFELVAGAAASLFDPPDVGTEATPFHEVMVFSEGLLHLFLRSEQSPTRATCFVCKSTVNLGMALSRSRALMPEIDKALQVPSQGQTRRG